MNYAFHVALSEVACETCYGIYTKSENAGKCAGWSGPENASTNGENNVDMLTQVN